MTRLPAGQAGMVRINADFNLWNLWWIKFDQEIFPL